MKTFLILGAGTGGTMMANKLAKHLDPQIWRIILVDREPEHYYQPGFLFVPFGFYKPESVVKPKRIFIPSNVEYIDSNVELIEPSASRVKLADGNRVIEYDQLLVATGVDIHPEEIEGMLGAGWQKNIFDFYTFTGSVKLAKFLKDFSSGRLVINIAEMPIKCPVAPLEFAFLADYYFTRRGIRNKVEIVYSTPLSGAFTKPVASKLLGDVMSKKNILVEPDFAISDVDSKKNAIHSYDGREIPYDLLVTIPTNMGAEVIQRSGMGDDLNLVPTNKSTLQSNQWPNVWVIGDASNIPTSKAGAVVHYEAETLLKNILSAIEGKDLPAAFDGHATCHITSGFNKSLLIDFNYDVEPLPGVYPFPVVGPFPLLKESTFNYWGKLSFKWIYWNIMLRGIPFPLPPAFSMAGKQK